MKFSPCDMLGEKVTLTETPCTNIQSFLLIFQIIKIIVSVNYIFIQFIFWFKFHYMTEFLDCTVIMVLILSSPERKLT